MSVLVNCAADSGGESSQVGSVGLAASKRVPPDAGTECARGIAGGVFSRRSAGRYRYLHR